MKAQILSLSLLLSSLVFSQKQGIITFKETINIDRQQEEMSEKLDSTAEANPQMAQFKELIKAQLEESKTKQMVLRFNKEESIYKKKEKDISTEQSNVSIVMISTGGEESVNYMNRTTKEYIISETFLGKTFLINEKPKQYKWKINTETKLILGRPCTKATTSDGETNIAVWFSSQIPNSIGPNDLNGLPGTILEASYYTKDTIIDEYIETLNIVATTIDLKDKNIKVTKPKKGKVVKNREELDAIIKERLKEDFGSGRGSINISTN